MVYSPLAVANFFIQRSLDTGVELTPMKLIKLVYIAHGWHLAVKKSELISEAVEAWKFGPVVPTVYHTFKDFGNCQIKSLAWEMRGLKYVIPQVEDPETNDFLDIIWNKYHDFNGLQLSTLTHETGTPWDTVFNHPQNKNKKGLIIPNDIIKKHYYEKMNINKDVNDPRPKNKPKPHYQS